MRGEVEKENTKKRWIIDLSLWRHVNPIMLDTDLQTNRLKEGLTYKANYRVASPLKMYSLMVFTIY